MIQWLSSETIRLTLEIAHSKISQEVVCQAKFGRV